MDYFLAAYEQQWEWGVQAREWEEERERRMQLEANAQNVRTLGTSGGIEQQEGGQGAATLQARDSESAAVADGSGAPTAGNYR